MKKAKLILAPFAAIFWFIAKFRRYAFNKWVKRYTSSVPTIGVGNLSMGGTGKTPACDFIIKELMLSGLRTAYLSRGYGRLEPGLKEVKQNATAIEVGDEALLMKHLNPSAQVIVSEKRVAGLKYVELQKSADVIVMDDGFQHLAFKAQSFILLTSYAAPYNSDFLFPAGYLREPIAARKEAHALVVTKCPTSLSEHKAIKMKKKLQFDGPVFFSAIKYGQFVEPVFKGINFRFEELKEKDVVLVTGIANPTSLIEKLKGLTKSIRHIRFGDHHNFKKRDFEKILRQREDNSSQIFLTTQKDAMRLATHPYKQLLAQLPLFFCSIEMNILFDKEKAFKDLISEYAKAD